MRKRIIYSSIFAAIIFFAFPFLIGFRVHVKIDDQWIAFFSSYAGGIFGGIVSGALTLGGVYLTLQHQNKLAKQEKAEKFDYTYMKIRPYFWSLDVAVRNDRMLNTADQIKNIRSIADEFKNTIYSNLNIIRTDYIFKKHVDSVIRRLDDITNRNHEISSDDLIKNFKGYNGHLQQTYNRLEEYDEELHKY